MKILFFVRLIYLAQVLSFHFIQNIYVRPLLGKGNKRFPVDLRAGDVSSEASMKIKELASPLLDADLIANTIEEWTKPLPKPYLSAPVIMVGPSGVGKGRMTKVLLHDYFRFFKKVVTHTSRNPRRDEINGTSYIFLEREELERQISQGLFIEHAVVHNNLYGVSKLKWEECRNSSKIILLEVNIEGARTIKRQASNLGIRPKFIFVSPTNISQLRERLIER